MRREMFEHDQWFAAAVVLDSDTFARGGGADEKFVGAGLTEAEHCR